MASRQWFVHRGIGRAPAQRRAFAMVSHFSLAPCVTRNSTTRACALQGVLPSMSLALISSGIKEYHAFPPPGPPDCDSCTSVGS